MTKILLGTAGIPISCRTNSTIEGIKTVSELGLQAMEIEFVQGIHMRNETAKEVGKTAEDFGITLSVHAPYAINLAAENKAILEGSKKRVLLTVERAHLMGAKIIAIHAGYYGRFTKEETFERIKKSFQEIETVVKQNGLTDVLLGCETTAKEKQWGTLDEILKISREVKQCYPYIDFAHLFAKQKGQIDYAKIFDKLEKEKIKFVQGHFEGMGKNKQGFYTDTHVPIDHNPPFEPLAKEILKRKIDTTIICESPVLEQDALKMKKMFEKLGYSFG